MADEVLELQSEDVPCFDSECDGIAEPELDGDHAFYCCQKCGFEFGYSKVEANTIQGGGDCAVGIPESVRRRASLPQDVPTGTPVTLGRKQQ